MSDIAREGVADWHAYMDAGAAPERLRAMLAEDAVFHSPVVHTPQQGRDRVFAYLDAASHVLGGQPSFTYVRELIDGDQAMLEFNLEIDGIHIDGVDIIRWNTDGLIVDFKVMVRPLKALNLVWEKMGAQLTRG